MLVCSPADKPLIMFHLVHSHAVRNALVFTKSAESTSRLLRLFEFFEEARIADEGSGDERVIARAYSSDSPPSERKTILDEFKAQKITMCVRRPLILERGSTDVLPVSSAQI
jgi:ATP-dependent RNA helicase DDX51/DBP6